MRTSNHEGVQFPTSSVLEDGERMRIRVLVGVIGGSACLGVGLFFITQSSSPATLVKAGSSPSAQLSTSQQLAEKWAAPLQSGSMMTSVTKVGIKQMTWGDLVPALTTFLGSEPLPGNLTSGESVYVVVQAGNFDNRALEGRGAGTYNWEVTVLDAATLDPAFDCGGPASSWPSFFEGLPGSETDYSPATGALTGP